LYHKRLFFSTVLGKKARNVLFSKRFVEKAKKLFHENSERGLTKEKEYDIMLYANEREQKVSEQELLAGVAEQADARDVKSRDT